MNLRKIQNVYKIAGIKIAKNIEIVTKHNVF